MLIKWYFRHVLCGATVHMSHTLMHLHTGMISSANSQTCCGRVKRRKCHINWWPPLVCSCHARIDCMLIAIFAFACAVVCYYYTSCTQQRHTFRYALHSLFAVIKLLCFFVNVAMLQFNLCAIALAFSICCSSVVVIVVSVATADLIVPVRCNHMRMQIHRRDFTRLWQVPVFLL